MHKPEVYPKGEFSNYMKKIAQEGNEVERYVKQLLSSQVDSDRYSFQEVFRTKNGMLARADVIRRNEDGTINLYEVKSSTSVKESSPHNQLKDAAFQSIAAEANGSSVNQIFIVHLNGDYIRRGDIEPQQLLTFSNETAKVRKITDETQKEIFCALNLLGKSKIDETSCSCLQLGKGKHCDSFE